MKRILFITPFPPSTIGAGVNYTRQLLEDLANSHYVDLIYFKSKSDNYYLSNNPNIVVLKKLNTSIALKFLNACILPFIFPLFTAKFSFYHLFQINKIIKSTKYDIIYLDFSQLFLYSKFINHPQIIMMSHDVIAQRYERQNKLIGLWAKYSERFVLSKANHIFTFSLKDSKIIKNYYNKRSKPTSFYFSKDVKNAIPQEIGDYFVCFAMWKRSDNYLGLKWFLLNVMPLIKSINIKIIGSSLPSEIIDLIKLYPHIEYYGFVDNPYPIIANSRALISPLFSGAGVKVKVLDAIATGTPVIGTDISFEGIDNIYKPLMIRANTKYEFKTSIEQINVNIFTRKEIKNQLINNSNQKSIISYIDIL